MTTTPAPPAALALPVWAGAAILCPMGSFEHSGRLEPRPRAGGSPHVTPTDAVVGPAVPVTEDGKPATAVAQLHHVSIERGDILYLDGEPYMVQGSVSLGFPVREITYHLAHISQRPGVAFVATLAAALGEPRDEVQDEADRAADEAAEDAAATVAQPAPWGSECEGCGADVPATRATCPSCGLAVDPRPLPPEALGFQAAQPPEPAQPADRPE